MVFQVGDNGMRWGSVLPAEVLFDDIKDAMGVEKVTLPGQEQSGEDVGGDEVVTNDGHGRDEHENEREEQHEEQRVGSSGDRAS